MGRHRSHRHPRGPTTSQVRPRWHVGGAHGTPPLTPPPAGPHHLSGTPSVARGWSPWDPTAHTATRGAPPPLRYALGGTWVEPMGPHRSHRHPRGPTTSQVRPRWHVGG